MQQVKISVIVNASKFMLLADALVQSDSRFICLFWVFFTTEDYGP